MTKPFIIVCDGMDSDIFEKLQCIKEFEVHPKSKVTQEELKELIPKAHGLVIRSATCPGKELIDSATNLKYIIRAGEGTDNIDKEYCAQKGIKVSNTPGANNNSAAEHALALMLTLLRKTAVATADMKKGNWNKALFTGNELTGKKVGIVGFGRIGQLLAKRLRGFDPQILFYDHNFQGKLEDSSIKQIHSIEDLFEESDVISLHVPKTEETANMVNKELLSLMKKDAILVNAARGGIINEKDLVEALKEEKFKGAALDVFDKEPLPANSELLELENIILTPHLGGSTEEAQVRVGLMAVDQLREFFLNDKLVNEVKA